MDTSKAEKIKAHARAIAELLYEETDAEALKSLEGIELAVRSQLLEQVGPEIGEFFAKQRVAPEQAAVEPLRASSETSKSQKSKRKS
jgi:hypothetical protein